MAWVFDQAPTKDSTAQLVLLAIADRCDDEGLTAYPSIGTLAKKTRLTKRTVIRAINRLRVSGVLDVQMGKGRRGTNLYSVVMAPCRRVTPVGQSPMTQGHSTPDGESSGSCPKVITTPDGGSPDPSGTSGTPSTSGTGPTPQIPAGSAVGKEIDDLAGAFLERYPDVYARCRHGAAYRVCGMKQERDLAYARELARGWPNLARLDAMLEIFLRRTDLGDKSKPGTPGQFLHMAPDCDRLLREHGR